MVLDWDTFWLDVMASHVPTGCVLAQVIVGNDWHPQAPGGHPQGIIPLQRGLVLSPGAPFWGNTDRSQGIFGTARCMWVSVPPKKRLYATLVHLVGAYNKYIKMSHKIIAIRDITSLNVIKRNRKKVAGRIWKFKKDKQSKHI